MREAHWGRGAKPLSIGSEEESEGVVVRGGSGNLGLVSLGGRGKVVELRKGVEGVVV